MSDDIKDPNRPRTVLHYRCQDCGQTEYKRIAEQGDFETLIDRQGRFAEMAAAAGLADGVFVEAA